MKKFIALFAIVALVSVAAAQDMTGLDSAKNGVAVQAPEQQQGGALFDQIMAKLMAQKAEIEANRVTRWAFDSRYGWIWLAGRDSYGWHGFSGSEQGYSEFAYAKEHLTPAEYAAFSQKAEEVWWALEAQGLN